MLKVSTIRDSHRHQETPRKRYSLVQKKKQNCGKTYSGRVFRTSLGHL